MISRIRFPALCTVLVTENVCTTPCDIFGGMVGAIIICAAAFCAAADTISAARPGARRETLETYTNRLKQLEDITNQFKGVDKSFAIQAGREIRVMVVPEQVSDDDMVLMARDIAKRIEFELEYPGQIKVNVIRESRVTDYAK